MNIKEFSSKILKCSGGHWRYVLRGERNLSFNKAKLIAQLFETDLETWIDGNRTVDRVRAWEKFIND
jgi:hypothetical protein